MMAWLEEAKDTKKLHHGGAEHRDGTEEGIGFDDS
jgi:hypothetical protein